MPRRSQRLAGLSAPSTKSRPPTNAKFPSSDVNYRQQPHLYRVSRGETGVLTCEPYKSELLPHWRFRTPSIASRSVEELLAKYNEYKRDNDFVGMDMSRKFIQMGYTRAMRYANHPGGKKYDKDGKVKPKEVDEEKKEAAMVFKKAWRGIVDEDEAYIEMKKEWMGRYK